ncbi:MAG: ACT domain-containing protein [Candidatus Aminicenantes bacterium]|nr:ACT domain-containing protein [Candidatus Aminicenantes bacterium]
MLNVKEEIELLVKAPNEPGILGRVLGTLANVGVNLKGLQAMSLNKTGLFRLITSDPQKAEKALKSMGYDVTKNKVITVLIEDRIGAGAEIGALLGNAVIDILYCYGTSAGKGNVLIVLKTTDNKKALKTLK